MRMPQAVAALCLSATLGVPGAAVADIKGINAAVQAGDYRTAAVEVKSA